MTKSVWAVFMLGVIACPAFAAGAGDEARLIGATVSSTVVAPKFSALNTAMAGQAAAWNSCGETAALRAAFLSAYDGWARVEFFRSGPLAQQTRAERVDYWPDPRNAVEKGVKGLLSLAAPTDITPQKIVSESVAAQGLPALERILFASQGETEKSLSDMECALGRGIANNLLSIASALDAEWNDGPDSEVARLKAALQDQVKGRESSVALLTDLATGIRIVEDKKIPALFGSKGSAPNPHAAKSWRSGRSERDLAVNLETLISAYQAIRPFAPQAAASVVEKLQDARDALADKDDQNRVFAIAAAINNAKYYAVDILPAEVGITLGFNSLDGD